MGTGPNDRRLSAYHIRRACEDSLRRLQADHIDLYQMHHIGRRTPWEEIWQAMELLVQQGKVIYVGSSNFAGWDIATAQCAAASRHFMGLVSEQSLYNLAGRTVELEVIPACRHYGLGLIPWSPLGGGLLGGALRKMTEGRRADKSQEIEQRRPQLAYVLLQLLGPSMLPAIIALAVHNGAILGYLMGRHSDALDDRPDAPKGLNLYAYDTTPRLYGQFLAYGLYRWEIIVRESAIFGILGVATLGYHVDAAISELRFDVAVVLILATVALCGLIDVLSRRLRQALRLSTLATRLADAPAR